MSTRVLIPCHAGVSNKKGARRVAVVLASCAFFQSGREVRSFQRPHRRSRQIRRGGARSGPAATLAPRWITHGTSATCTRCARGAASARWRGRSRSPRSSRSRTSPSRRRPRCAPRRGRRGWACRLRSRRRSSSRFTGGEELEFTPRPRTLLVREQPCRQLARRGARRDASPRCCRRTPWASCSTSYHSPTTSLQWRRRAMRSTTLQSSHRRHGRSLARL